MSTVVDAYIRPSDEVVGSLLERLDDRIIDNKVGEIDAKAILEEVHERFDTAVIAANVDVGLEIGNDAVVAYPSLLADGFEEKFQALADPGLKPGPRVLDASTPKAVPRTPQMSVGWNAMVNKDLLPS
jgi:hypothetical protein